GRDATRVCGEVLDRDEVSLKVASGAGELAVVLVEEDTPITVPGKKGAGALGDILYHLDVEKMSKSKKNVVAPDELVADYGADTVRAYLMFGWRWERGGPWDSKGIEGVARWIKRVWSLVLETPRKREPATPEAKTSLLRAMHQAIKAVTEDLESFSFNTAIARLMEYSNALGKAKDAFWGAPVWDEAVSALLLLLAPITPHLAEELWAQEGKPYSVHQQSWPTYNEALLVEDTIEVPVQINGKVRGRITVAAGAGEETIKAAALAEPNVRRYTEGKEIVKLIVPRGKLVSIVVR
ncbi:MAG: class I tRNA ligase family protein, partial [Chloroflexota bacterium]|nr:class I tRNA ligase family protein [Chloroflexota bacterium]